MGSRDATVKTVGIRALLDDWPDSVFVLVLLEGFSFIDADCWWNSCSGWYCFCGLYDCKSRGRIIEGLTEVNT